MPTFAAEIQSQPQSLRDLAAYYHDSSPLDGISASPPDDLILTGMGASLHAAQIGAAHLQSHGLRAVALEAGELIQYGMPLIRDGNKICFISQSGRSAEVAPLLSITEQGRVYLALTNDPDSPLARHAGQVLPLQVKNETLVATQTYTNSLAVLWMLSRKWARVWSPADMSQILKLADRIDELFISADSVADAWLSALQECRTLIFTGFGLHAATARQSAQTVAEWAKAPALGMSAGALRHGFIEVVDSGSGVVVFTGADRTREFAQRLADELLQAGAKVLVVQQGRAESVGAPARAGEALDEFLAPALDMIPVQYFAQALRAARGVPEGFRYLSKVVEKL